MSRRAGDIKTYEYRALKPGPALLVFGAIHGNEICGVKAVQRVMGQLDKRKIVLEKGSVTFVPVANPYAYKKNVRYVEENLNRVFRPTKNPKSIEARLANELCPFVDRCDVLLDIHSTTAKGTVFTYLDFPTRRNRSFANILGSPFVVTGWPEFYERQGGKRQSFDTTAYAAKQGKDCLLIECGQHEDPKAPAVAYRAIINAMRHYGLIKGKAKAQKVTEVRISAGYFRDNMKDRLAGKWKHLDKVKKGEPLILKGDGAILPAPYDAFVIMPKATAGLGEDWLYLGKSNKRKPVRRNR